MWIPYHHILKLRNSFQTHVWEINWFCLHTVKWHQLLLSSWCLVGCCRQDLFNIVNTPQDTNYTATCLPSRKLYKLDEPDTHDTAGEARTNSSMMYSNGQTKAGWPARTYIQQLCEDTGCSPEDLPKAMNDREKWRERVRDIRASGTTWWWWWWWWWWLLSNNCNFICTELNGPKHHSVTLSI